jgi:hypothetical protein
MRTTIAVLVVAATVAASCVVPSALAGGTKAAKAAKAASAPTGDLRAYMHGIGAVSDAQGVTTVFFSSSGLPPRGAGRDRNWTHDVYVARWTPQQPKLDRPRVFISRPEAQEPVSVAQNDTGRVMVSFEDGWNTPNEVSQRYGVYTADLKDVKPYPNDVLSGGHSGHVAAVGSRFVVFYSNDWVNGGGVDNLGTGNGVYVKTYDADGALLQAIAEGRDARSVDGRAQRAARDRRPAAVLHVCGGVRAVDRPLRRGCDDRQRQRLRATDRRERSDHGDARLHAGVGARGGHRGDWRAGVCAVAGRTAAASETRARVDRTGGHAGIADCVDVYRQRRAGALADPVALGCDEPERAAGGGLQFEGRECEGARREGFVPGIAVRRACGNATGRTHPIFCIDVPARYIGTQSREWARV